MNNITFINASAGSGKTYTVIEKVFNIIKSGTFPTRIILATFTNKAADELNRKLREKLVKEGMHREALMLPNSFVGTLHGICAKLLTDYAIDIGFSPKMALMEEDDAKVVFDMATSQYMLEYADVIEPLADALSKDIRNDAFNKSGWNYDIKSITDMAAANKITPEALREGADEAWEMYKRIFLDTPSYEGICETPVKWKDLIDKNVPDNLLSNPNLHEQVRKYIHAMYNCAAACMEAYSKYKEARSIVDFSDLEQRVLTLLNGNPYFQDVFRERFDYLFVDEFQDTNPTQLAIYMKLSALVKESVWVGDRKQSIYKFRGAAPEITEMVCSEVKAAASLDRSWRSKENLVNFASDLFEKVFHYMPVEDVRLKVADDGKDRSGGSVETWYLDSKNNTKDAECIAYEVKKLIDSGKYKANDIAILCRKRDHCASIVKGLSKYKISSSYSGGKLAEEEECVLALAALAYMDDGNELSLVTIAKLTNICGDWLDKLVEDKKVALESFAADTRIGKLIRDDILSARVGKAGKISGKLSAWSLSEKLDYAIDAIGLADTINTWDFSARRIANIDSLRFACKKYINHCRKNQEQPTVVGFTTYLDKAEITAQTDESSVNVMTYHQSKGLEWKVVIMHSLGGDQKCGPFGISVYSSESDFDMHEPLKGRKIRYWINPFGKAYVLLTQKADESDICQDVLSRQLEEEKRLLYVGITRAKEKLVFAIRRDVQKSKIVFKSTCLDILTDSAGEKLLTFDDEGAKWCEEFIDTKRVTAEDYFNLKRAANFRMPNVKDAPFHPAAKGSPSTVSEMPTDEEFCGFVDFGRIDAKITIKGENWQGAGNAVHGYFGVVQENLSVTVREDIARGQLCKYGVSESIEPSELIKSAEQFFAFIIGRFPNSRLCREIPMVYKTPEHQLFQGFIDLLIETPAGCVIVDYKCYPGSDTKRLESYAPQLCLYKKALEAAGKKVLHTLIFTPVTGKIYEIKYK